MSHTVSLSASWAVRSGVVVKTSSKAPSFVPSREDSVLAKVPFFARATWMLPGAFEEPIPKAIPWNGFSSPPPVLTHSCEVGREESRVRLIEPKSAICLS